MFSKKEPILIPMKTAPFFILSTLATTFGWAADVTVHAVDIPFADYSVTPFTTADGKMSFGMSGSTYSVGGNAPNSFGGAAGGTNVNAFDAGDGVTMSLTFANDAGLRQFGSIWTNTSVQISGFIADPGVSTTGAGGATASYNAGSGTVTLSQAWAAGTVVLYDFSNPAASAGTTLTFTFGGGNAGYQWAMNRIVYEDSLVSSGPVITTPMPAETQAIADVTTTLSVVVDTSILPAATYLWEFDDGGGFTQVGTEPTYQFVGGAATNGTYRVTLDNGQGTDSSTTVVTSVDDGDGINNQWEIDFFGDHTLHDGAADPDLDGLTNSEEFAAGTNPANADTDGDGLTDGEEATEGTNPLLLDSDGDGYGDGYELNVSLTDPGSVASTRGVSAGRNSIGITFASSRGLNRGVNLSTTAIAGAPEFAQSNWNVSGVLGNIGQISEGDIVGPVSETLVDSSGNVTTMGFEAEVASTWSTTFNREQPIGGLLSGYLYVDAATPAGVLDLSGIPYARYDVVIYLISQNGGGRALINEFDASPRNEFNLRTTPLVARGIDPVWSVSSDPSVAVDGSNENYPAATHVIFRGLTGSDASFDLTRVLDNVGFAAIQVVEDLDGDGDGMGDFYEASVGLDPADDGTTDAVRQGTSGDFDGDGISNIAEHRRGTNPTSNDSDGDGVLDQHETDTGVFVSATDTGTDPLIADTDGDGARDGAEVLAGVNPLGDGDTDQDGWLDSYELINGFDANDPGSPGSPNGGDPLSFGIAFNSNAGPGAATEFGEFVYAGAPGVEQRNWNRTNDIANTGAGTTGGLLDIQGPQAASLVDSVGDLLTGVTFDFVSGGGAYAGRSETGTPFGLLFNSWIYSGANVGTTVTIGNIPYSEYDVYVYFGADTNNRQAKVSSTAGGATYSFATDSNATAANSLAGATYVETTDTGEGYPRANYAVFRGVTSSTFDVTTTSVAGNVGIYGVQVVGGGPGAGAAPTLINGVLSGNRFTADFTAPRSGTYVFERSLNLQDLWVPVGAPLTVSAGVFEVVDPAVPPGGKAFYRVRRE
jgi:hypothetical protein